MQYAHTLTAKSVLLNLPGQDADSIFQSLVDGLIAQRSGLKPRRAELLAALHARELQGSTASQGVAIPHVKLADLTEATVVIGLHPSGVEFRALDGGRVHVFFTVVRPEATADQHLGLLRWFASIAQHRDFVNFARQTRTAQEVLDLLSELTPA